MDSKMTTWKQCVRWQNNLACQLIRVRVTTPLVMSARQGTPWQGWCEQ